jgi:NADP-dependent 3-hydroxy acid dehydrogenase YdfG
VDEWDRQIEVNIRGVLYGVAAALPQNAEAEERSHHQPGFRSRDRSVDAVRTVYSATKFAVRALTEGLRMELHSDNIRCAMISPGAIASELQDLGRATPFRVGRGCE